MSLSYAVEDAAFRNRSSRLFPVEVCWLTDWPDDWVPELLVDCVLKSVYPEPVCV